MAKVTLRLYTVPAEFRRQSRNEEYICHHFYSRVANRTTILDEEICVCGFHSDRPGDGYKRAVLCLDCAKRFSKKDRGIEIVPWPAQHVPIEDKLLFKDSMKK